VRQQGYKVSTPLVQEVFHAGAFHSWRHVCDRRHCLMGTEQPLTFGKALVSKVGNADEIWTGLKLATTSKAGYY